MSHKCSTYILLVTNNANDLCILAIKAVKTLKATNISVIDL